MKDNKGPVLKTENTPFLVRLAEAGWKPEWPKNPDWKYLPLRKGDIRSVDGIFVTFVRGEKTRTEFVGAVQIAQSVGSTSADIRAKAILFLNGKNQPKEKKDYKKEDEGSVGNPYKGAKRTVHGKKYKTKNPPGVSSYTKGVNTKKKPETIKKGGKK